MFIFLNFNIYKYCMQQYKLKPILGPILISLRGPKFLETALLDTHSVAISMKSLGQQGLYGCET